MAKLLFTEEEMKALRENPYVESVTSKTVSFTAEFKRYFYNRALAGITSRQIFLECEIDPDVLGEKRIAGFRHTLNSTVKKGLKFTDRREKKFKDTAVKNKSTEARIKYLEHELAYTRQEVEFLKKLQMADMEARREWESRHPPK